MVAACSANRAPEASVSPIASELGSLLLEHRSIQEPRWRLHAVVAQAPVFRHLGISLESGRDERHRSMEAATCPPPLRDHIATRLEQHVEHGRVEGLWRLVDALFTPEWNRCATEAIAGMLALGDRPAAELMAIAANARRYAPNVVRPLLQTGIRDGEVVGNVDATDSECAYRPSLPLLRACVDAIVAKKQRARIADAERLARMLPDRERAIAEAHLARLTLCFDMPAAALSRVRAIRERSVRAGGLLLLTRSTDDVATMRMFTSAIEARLLRQVATLEVTRALYRSGLHRHALRALQHVDDPRLAAERTLLGAEMRLTTCRTEESRTFVESHLMSRAYRSPAWTHVEPVVALEVVDDLIQGVVFARCGVRHTDDDMLEYAVRYVRGHELSRCSRRYFLDLATRAGIDLDAALLCLQDGGSRAALDALRAERIALTASRLVDDRLPEAMVLGLAASPIAVSDARSLARAHYDEAVALSPAASTRRRVLIATAQTCLRSALSAPDEWPVDVIAARLRTLVHLGGGLAVDAIRKALVTLPAHPTLTPLALEALCRLDAPAAAGFVLERATGLREASVDLVRLIQLLELHGAVPRGMWTAFAAAARSLQRHGLDSLPWLAELLVLMRDRVDALFRMVRGLASHTVIPTTARALLAEIDEVPTQLVDRDHSTIARQLSADICLLEAFLLARPASVDPKMRTWTSDQWRALLRTAVDYAPVHAPQVVRFVRKVGRRHWYEALRNADLARLGAAMVTTFDVRRTTYRLRVLDKRLDILTYLRFADVPARSCFRSDSFRGRASDTIEAWKDPLTICCHVERAGGAPIGFLFGSFAAVDDQPALVMNSLHVRPNGGELRSNAIRAFERAVCEPLGITWIGIANQHGGKGELPPGYVRRPQRVMRFRALARNGSVLTSTYDDVADSGRLNEPGLVENLFWRS